MKKDRVAELREYVDELASGQRLYTDREDERLHEMLMRVIENLDLVVGQLGWDVQQLTERVDDLESNIQ